MQRQARGKKITEQIIHMKCEWLECTYKSDNYVQFKSHIKSHIPNVYIKTYDSGESKIFTQRFFSFTACEYYSHKLKLLQSYTPASGKSVDLKHRVMQK